MLLATKYRLVEYGANLPQRMIENWTANNGVNPLKIAGWSVEEGSAKNNFFGLGCISLIVLFLFNMTVFSPDFREYSIGHTWVYVVLTILIMLTVGLLGGAFLIMRLPKELKTQLDEFVETVRLLQSYISYDFLNNEGKLEQSDVDCRVKDFLTALAVKVVQAETITAEHRSEFSDSLEESDRTRFKKAYWFFHSHDFTKDKQDSYFDRAREVIRQHQALHPTGVGLGDRGAMT